MLRDLMEHTYKAFGMADPSGLYPVIRIPKYTAGLYKKTIEQGEVVETASCFSFNLSIICIICLKQVIDKRITTPFCIYNMPALSGMINDYSFDKDTCFDIEVGKAGIYTLVYDDEDTNTFSECRFVSSEHTEIVNDDKLKEKHFSLEKDIGKTFNRLSTPAIVIKLDDNSEITNNLKKQNLVLGDGILSHYKKLNKEQKKLVDKPSYQYLFTPTVKDGKLMFQFNSTYDGIVSGQFTVCDLNEKEKAYNDKWYYPIIQTIKALSTVGKKTITLYDEGAMVIDVDTEYALYRYVLPAQHA